MRPSVHRLTKGVKGAKAGKDNRMSPLILSCATCLGILGYTYAGYPLVIAIWARLRSRPIAADCSWRPQVSVLCSVYNGGADIVAKLASIRELDYPSELVDIWFYDDCSSDDSRVQLDAIAKQFANVHVIHGLERSGKPTALNRLAAEAAGDVFLLTDIRQSLSSASLTRLVAALGDFTIGCAGGTLELKSDSESGSGAGAYWHYERWIRRNESRFRSVVGVSGSLYAIRALDFPVIPVDMILDDLFVPMSVRMAGKRVVLIDEAIATDRAADDGREFARKVRTLAGNYQLLTRMPRLLVPFLNPSWFELVSHKLLRLVCPWALIGLAVCSGIGALTGSPFMIGLVGVQAVAYIAALLGPAAGKVGRLARTFVVLNSAAVVGLSRFIRGKQAITW